MIKMASGTTALQRLCRNASWWIQRWTARDDPHPLPHRFQEFQSMEALWWITDHYTSFLPLFLTPDWACVHSGTRSALLFRLCSQAAQPGQWHKTNRDLIPMLPGGKRVRSRAGAGYMVLQISWQPPARDHRHRQRSESSASENRDASPNKRKLSPHGCHHGSVGVQNQKKPQLSRQVLQSLP